MHHQRCERLFPWVTAMRLGSASVFIPGVALAVGLTLAASSNPAIAGSEDAVFSALKLPKASLLVEERGRVVISHHPDRAMVPASTMKILTALAAIERWGLDHRFSTDFFLGHDNRLWVKGYGDPYLVSEELDLIAKALKARGVREIAGIGTDDNYFHPSVEISGRSSSDNPYDAPVTALAANFNTVNVVNRGGKVRSAEAQTPLTPMARRFGQQLGTGEHRVNLEDRDKAVRYFGEILSAKLVQAGIHVDGDPRDGSVPSRAEKVYSHENSRDLQSVVSAMLEYSNNFIANALFLKLADKSNGRPLSMSDAQGAFSHWVDQTFGWRGYRIDDGAGLSRGNRLSARQLLDVVSAFAPYKELLPKQNAGVRAKTGTLRGVSCYAGFVNRGGRWEPFSLLINQPVSYNFRLQVANGLANAPDLSRLCPGGSC
ncbi:MAG: D-alanyl-D-alanine carboxypeptidase [Chromatiaceae bacterium]|nr:D-alanyl-D-alanine carboxypeptidase [Chromatiaceae bacterium]